MLVTFSPNHLTPPSGPRSIPTSTMKPSLSTPDRHQLLQHPYAFARVKNHTPFLDFFITSCAPPLVRSFPDPALGAGGRRHTVPPPRFRCSREDVHTGGMLSHGAMRGRQRMCYRRWRRKMLHQPQGRQCRGLTSGI